MRTGRKWARIIVCFLLLCGSFSVYIACQLYQWNTTAEWSGWAHSTDAFSHYLCVLVPFRDRDAELSQFTPYLHNFLVKQNVRHEIVVLNQTDNWRFNRASLINVGWFEADRIGCDYLVMHDVDLLPMNPALMYTFPQAGTVRHIASPEYHPKYNYSKFVGGILMLTMEDFKTINGMSNKYWGWGLEDDEFYLRLRDAHLVIDRPRELYTDRETTFRHLHGSERRRDFTRHRNGWKQEREEKRKRDLRGGLNQTQYQIKERSFLDIGSYRVRIIHVELKCDTKRYPYCRDSP